MYIAREITIDEAYLPRDYCGALSPLLIRAFIACGEQEYLSDNNAPCDLCNNIPRRIMQFLLNGAVMRCCYVPCCARPKPLYNAHFEINGRRHYSGNWNTGDYADLQHSPIVFRLRYEAFYGISFDTRAPANLVECSDIMQIRLVYHITVDQMDAIIYFVWFVQTALGNILPRELIKLVAAAGVKLMVCYC